MIDTLIFLVIYILLLLGAISVVNAIDELFLGGIIGDTLTQFLDKVADVFWRIADKVRRKK